MEKSVGKKSIPVIVIAGLAIALVVGFVFFKVVNKKPAIIVPKTGGLLNSQEDQIIPTVGAGVSVDLTRNTENKDVTLKIEGIPEDTQTIDYELSYEERTKGLQGAIGTISINTGEKEFKKSITLGTCSSGKCVYHDVVGPIKVTLKFSGGYGDKIFEKEYSI